MSKKLTTKEFVDRAIEIHGLKYDYSKSKYVGIKKKIEVRCKIHGSFWLTPDDHFSGNGCSKCSGLYVPTNEEWIFQAKQLHRGRYDYSKVQYTNAKTNVSIICSKHGEFLQTPGHHLEGVGCPRCCRSKGELLVENWLEDREILYISQMEFDGCKGKRNKKLRFDFYLPHHNILIEVDGPQHYGIVKFNGYTITPEQYKRIQEIDHIKTRFAFDQKIKLVRIPYRNKDDYNKITDTLKKEIV